MGRLTFYVDILYNVYCSSHIRVHFLFIPSISIPVFPSFALIVASHRGRVMKAKDERMDKDIRIEYMKLVHISIMFIPIVPTVLFLILSIFTCYSCVVLSIVPHSSIIYMIYF